MNPFLSKPLRKVQPGTDHLKNTSAEHRPSRFLNAYKKANVNPDKKVPDLPKIKNPSPRKQNPNTNNINIISKFSDEKKNINTKPNENEQRVNNLQKESTLQRMNLQQKISNIKKENVDTNLIIDNYINISLTGSEINPKSELNKLVFNNNDEILEYIKNQIKDGKIKDIKSKLEIKTSDFTGYTLSKKKQGYTIYEIELEEDLEKVNETIKNQKVEIGKKPIQIVFAPEPKQLKKDIDKKKESERKSETLIQTMKNRTMEREMMKAKKDIINDEIKNLQNKIQKQKVELKNAENENDYIRKEIEKKSNIKPKIPNREEPKRRETEAKVKINENEQSNAANNIEQKRTIEDNQKKANRALARFKKVYSSHKPKEDNTENVVTKPPESSGKIQSLAAILQEHIIKPLAEMRAEGGDMRPRGGSVECRMIKKEGMAELLENAPVQRKKKPKITAFE